MKIDPEMVGVTIHPLAEECRSYKAASALTAAICSENTQAEDDALEVCVWGDYPEGLIKQLIIKSRSMDEAAIKQLQGAIAYSYDLLNEKFGNTQSP